MSPRSVPAGETAYMRPPKALRPSPPVSPALGVGREDTDGPARNLGAVCFFTPGDVSATTRTRLDFPTATTRMQAHSIDAVLASSDDALFSIAPRSNEPGG
jgi:hypothetical protein